MTKFQEKLISAAVQFASDYYSYGLWDKEKMKASDSWKYLGSLINRAVDVEEIEKAFKEMRP